MTAVLTVRPSFSASSATCCVERPHVLQGAVHVGVFGAGNVQPGGVGARGQDQLVIGVVGQLAVGHGLDSAVFRIDGGHLGAADQGDGGVLPQGGIAQRQVRVHVRQGLAQRHPVIGGVGLLGQHRQVPVLKARGRAWPRQSGGRRGRHQPPQSCGSVLPWCLGVLRVWLRHGCGLSLRGRSLQLAWCRHQRVIPC